MVTLLGACSTGMRSAFPVPRSCFKTKSAEERTVLRSPEFRTAARMYLRSSGSEGMADSQLVGYYGWICKEMATDTVRLPEMFITVRTIAIDGIERRDMVFGVARDHVWLMNPWVFGTNDVSVDTTSWNSFVRARLKSQLDSPEKAAALACMLDAAIQGWGFRHSCPFLPASVVRFADQSWRVTMPDGTNRRYRLLSDGRLDSNPAF